MSGDPSVVRPGRGASRWKEMQPAVSSRPTTAPSRQRPEVTDRTRKAEQDGGGRRHGRSWNKKPLPDGRQGAKGCSAEAYRTFQAGLATRSTEIAKPPNRSPARYRRNGDSTTAPGPWCLFVAKNREEPQPTRRVRRVLFSAASPSPLVAGADLFLEGGGGKGAKVPDLHPRGAGE